MKKKQPDLFLIAILCIIGIILSFIIYLPRTSSGNFVEVRLDGQVIASYPLDAERTETIHAVNGINTFKIKNGTVTMTHADCHDRVCVTMKSISHSGETIVCLPHKLVLEVVTDNNDTPPMDAVTGGAP